MKKKTLVVRNEQELTQNSIFSRLQMSRSTIELTPLQSVRVTDVGSCAQASKLTASSSHSNLQVKQTYNLNLRNTAAQGVYSGAKMLK